ncbi:MAG: beta-propeller fold lactonase family protein [Luteitalea sp.]|nr:beta-propeller fold lactonase family protein [Luteitalea sp.]
MRLLHGFVIGAVLAAMGCGGSAGEPTTTNARAEAQDRPGAYRIYVTNEMSGDLSVIDGATHEVIATVPLGKRPRGIHASPDRQTIYVALSGSPISPPGVDESTLPPPDRSADGIGRFNLQANELEKVLESGSDPEEFDLSPDGRLLYISNEDKAEASILDTASGKIIKALPVGEEPEGVTTSPDGSVVYVTSEGDHGVAVIDTAKAEVIANVPVGLRPRDSAFLPDGSKAYVTLENEAGVAVVDPRSHKKIKTIKLGAPTLRPMAIALSPDAAEAYVSTGRGGQVVVFDTASDEVTASFEVGERPWGIAVSPDGRYLYTANGPSNDVSVVDLAKRTVIKKIEVGDRPWGVITVER